MAVGGKLVGSGQVNGPPTPLFRRRANRRPSPKQGSMSLLRRRSRSWGGARFERPQPVLLDENVGEDDELPHDGRDGNSVFVRGNTRQFRGESTATS